MKVQVQNKEILSVNTSSSKPCSVDLRHMFTVLTSASVRIVVANGIRVMNVYPLIKTVL